MPIQAYENEGVVFIDTNILIYASKGLKKDNVFKMRRQPFVEKYSGSIPECAYASPRLFEEIQAFYEKGKIDNKLFSKVRPARLSGREKEKASEIESIAADIAKKIYKRGGFRSRLSKADAELIAYALLLKDATGKSVSIMTEDKLLGKTYKIMSQMLEEDY